MSWVIILDNAASYSDHTHEVKFTCEMKAQADACVATWNNWQARAQATYDRIVGQYRSEEFHRYQTEFRDWTRTNPPPFTLDDNNDPFSSELSWECIAIEVPEWATVR